MIKYIILLLIFLLLIDTASSTEIIYVDSNTFTLSMYANNASYDLPSEIIMQELPMEFLSNVSYIDRITIQVGAGTYINNTSYAPNGKLYFKLYKKLQGNWTYQGAGGFWNPSYYDLGSPIYYILSSPLYIDTNYDYGVGFYSDVTDISNGSWHLLGSRFEGIHVPNPSGGYNVWQTDSNYVCNFNVVHVCDSFSDIVNIPKLHNVYPENYNFIWEGNIGLQEGLIYLRIDGQFDTPPTPTPTPTGVPTPTPTPTPIPTNTPYPIATLKPLPNNTEVENLTSNWTNIYTNNSGNGSIESWSNTTGITNTVNTITAYIKELNANNTIVRTTGYKLITSGTLDILPDEIWIILMTGVILSIVVLIMNK